MYCIYCGAKIKETSMYCGKCGKPISPKSTDNSENIEEDFEYSSDPNLYEEETIPVQEESFEDPYQTNRESTPDVSFDFKRFKSSVKDFSAKASETASKAASQAKVAASQAKEKMDKSIEDGVSKEIAKANASQKEKAGLVSDEYSGTNYMSSTELWTWLKKDSKRQQFFTDEISEEKEDDYIEELSNKLSENYVPVTIEKREISWDRSNAKEELYVAIPKTKVVNPLTYIVQFSHVGKFTFVEEKTFITPPDLPTVPHNKVPNNGIKGGVAIYILLAGILGLLVLPAIGMKDGGVSLLCVGLIAFACYQLYKIHQINEYNKKCDAELKAWNEAWDNWRTSIFLHSFQEDINGQLSRIFDSVFSCINQINEEKFKGKKTLEVQDSSDMNELEQMISRKQAEYR